MGGGNESFTDRQNRLQKEKTMTEATEGDEAKLQQMIETEMAEEIDAAGNVQEMGMPDWATFAMAIGGSLQFYYKVIQEREKRADEHFQNPRPDIHAFVASMGFEVGVAIAIVINCFLLGWEASIKPGHFETLFDFCENIFVFVFLVEWTLRILAFGWVWIFEWSNFADTVMVFIFGVLPKWVLPLVGIDASFIRIFTVLRCLRLARLARAVRMKPAFKELWVLIHGLTTSFRPLFWTLLIAMILLFLWGLAATEMIGKSEDFQDDEVVQELFGDLLKSMFTMFQLMTLDTWADTIARPVIDVEGHWNFAWFFVGFIGLGVFVFWNLITAIIVNTAFEITQNDDNSKAKEFEENKKSELAALAELFLEIDTDGSGELTIDEFFGAIRNKKVCQMLAVLDVQPSELEEVWRVLDDGDGLLTIKEFTTGIRRMRGQAKAKDMADCLKRLRIATNSTAELNSQADQFHSSLRQIEDEVARIADDTGRMVGLFHEMYHRLNGYTEITKREDKQREKDRKVAKQAALQLAEEAELAKLANEEEDE